MKSDTMKSANKSFWIISIMALLWNVGGCINYVMQMDVEFVSTLPLTHQAIIIDRPVWATGGFAIGVFGGAIASLLLLFRKSTALYVFILSLLGIFVTMIHTFNVAKSKIEFSTQETFVMILLPVIVVAIFIWYTKRAIARGWLD